jgi:hypothetical protein
LSEESAIWCFFAKKHQIALSSLKLSFTFR